MRGIDTRSRGDRDGRGGTENAGVGVFEGFVKKEESDSRGGRSAGKWRGLDCIRVGGGGVIIGRFVSDSRV